uniref:Uncharacterized protein n=1 Tax=Caenorhabditis tropicalis TaxID=1561998 RepID=A0A1I7U0V1_9PELO
MRDCFVVDPAGLSAKEWTSPPAIVDISKTVYPGFLEKISLILNIDIFSYFIPISVHYFQQAFVVERKRSRKEREEQCRHSSLSTIW